VNEKGLDMRTGRFKAKSISSFVLALILLVVPATSGADADVKVLLLPFSINADRDLSFLQRGIADMLSTRLVETGKVDLIAPEISSLPQPINSKTAAALGQKAGADYVIFGSLTALGDRTSLDGMVIDVGQGKPALAFSKESVQQAELLDDINLFVTRIKTELLAAKPSAPSPVTQQKPRPAEAAPAVAAVSPPAPSGKIPPASAPSPATQEKHRPAEAAPAVAALPPPSPSGEIPPATSAIVRVERPAPAWTSENFGGPVTSMAVGDVDGDGTNEVVFAIDKKIYVHRYAAAAFPRVTEWQVPERTHEIISLDAADINGNGRAEIFVTTKVESRREVRSCVLEWDGVRLKTVADGLEWYLRVADATGRGRVLVGQKRGGQGEFFAGPVYEFGWTSGRYEPTRELPLPSGLNVYNFTYGNALNTGHDVFVSFVPHGYLRVQDANGTEKWQSAEMYGGSAVFLEFPNYETSSLGGGAREMIRVYLPQRIFIRDIDRAGKHEVIVTKNADVADRVLMYTRLLRKGQIDGLEWDGKELVTAWKTKEFSGYIADYAVVDIDNDGADELVAAVVTRGKSVSGFFRDTSYISVGKLGD
jgi:TolB-like protein